MVLSGDDLATIPADRMAMLQKLLPPTGVAAAFDDEALRVGRVRLDGKSMLCLFNAEDAPATLSARLDRAHDVRDVWSGDSLGRQSAVTLDLPPRSARLLECVHG
jgi:alpha-galactosidase